MSTSGFVFCYTCILPHVQRYGHCPVTGVPMTAEQASRVCPARAMLHPQYLPANELVLILTPILILILVLVLTLTLTLTPLIALLLNIT